MQKTDLARLPSAVDVSRFATAIIGLAYTDWREGRKEYHRTGAELTELFTDNSRVFHQRMASGIYNNALRTFACGDR